MPSDALIYSESNWICSSTNRSICDPHPDNNSLLSIQSIRGKSEFGVFQIVKLVFKVDLLKMDL